MSHVVFTICQVSIVRASLGTKGPGIPKGREGAAPPGSMAWRIFLPLCETERPGFLEVFYIYSEGIFLIFNSQNVWLLT